MSPENVLCKDTLTKGNHVHQQQNWLKMNLRTLTLMNNQLLSHSWYVRRKVSSELKTQIQMSHHTSCRRSLLTQKTKNKTSGLEPTCTKKRVKNADQQRQTQNVFGLLLVCRLCRSNKHIVTSDSVWIYSKYHHSENASHKWHGGKKTSVSKQVSFKDAERRSWTVFQ